MFRPRRAARRGPRSDRAEGAALPAARAARALERSQCGHALGSRRRPRARDPGGGRRDRDQGPPDPPQRAPRRSRHTRLLHRRHTARPALDRAPRPPRPGRGARPRPQRARPRHAVGGAGVRRLHPRQARPLLRPPRPPARAGAEGRAARADVGDRPHRRPSLRRHVPRLPARPRVRPRARRGRPEDRQPGSRRARSTSTTCAAAPATRRRSRPPTSSCGGSWACAASTTSRCSTSTVSASRCEVRPGGSASGSCAMSGRRDRSRAPTSPSRSRRTSCGDFTLLDEAA